ncbi:MAG: VOC family protein [Actinomycetota bacterium]
MAHPIVGFEITGTDVGALCAFYDGLFGWSVVGAGTAGDAVEVDTNGGTGLTGRIVTAAAGSGSAVSIGVPDLRAALDAVVAAGGSVSSGAVEAGSGASARFADPAGNAARLVASIRAARPSPGAGAPVTYVEVFGPGLFGPGGLLAFYTGLFGWAPLHGQTGGVPYVQVDPGRGDVVAAIGDDGRGTSRVVLYAAVAELGPFCDKASALGGSVAVPPTDVDGTVQFAHLTDPQGTTVGVWRKRSG